jgi:hypothetical protein
MRCERPLHVARVSCGATQIAHPGNAVQADFGIEIDADYQRAVCRNARRLRAGKGRDCREGAQQDGERAHQDAFLPVKKAWMPIR